MSSMMMRPKNCPNQVTDQVCSPAPGSRQSGRGSLPQKMASSGLCSTLSSEQLQLCQVSPGPVVVLAWCHPPPTTVYQRFLGTGPAWPEEFFDFGIDVHQSLQYTEKDSS